MKQNKKKWLWLILVLVVLGVVYLPYLFGDLDYVIGYDTKNIYVPFYEEIRNMFEKGELPFWNHNFFLGGCVLASKGYYFLGDIFAYAAVVLKTMDIVDLLLVIQILKFFVCIVLCNVLLKKMGISEKVRWFASFLYVFSSWMLMFMGTPAFATFAALLPLLFIGLELYLKEKKIWVVALASFVLVLDNFYLYWSASFYLILYWPCRYFLMHNFTKEKLIDFVKDTAYLVLIYALGALAGSFMLIPTLDYMVNVPRVANNSTVITLLWDRKQVYLDMFVKFISSPFYVNTEIANFFGRNYYRTDQIALFASSLIPIILPQIFVVCNKKEKVIYSLFFVINGIMLVFPIFGSLMHGFAEPSFRWTIMLVFCLTLIAARLLNDYKKMDIRLIVKTIALYALGFAVICVYKKNVMDYPEQMMGIVLSFVLFVVYAGLLFKGKKNEMLFTILGAVVVAETTLMAGFTLYNYALRFQEGYDMDSVGIDSDYFTSFGDTDEFYRIYVDSHYVDLDHQEDFNYNSNMVYDFKGVYGYDSTTQYSTAEILLWEDQYYWWYSITNPELLDQLAVKYYVTKEKYLPNENFELIEKMGTSEYSLYLNTDYIPFGTATDTVMGTSEFYLYSTPEDKTKAYDQALIVDQQDYEKYGLNELAQSGKQTMMRDVAYTSNHISGKIALDSKQIVFLAIPFDKGWEVKVNGEITETLRCEGGFMGLLLNAGEYEIEMNFIPYGLKLGCVLSGISIVLLCLLDYLRKRGAVK